MASRLISSRLLQKRQDAPHYAVRSFFSWGSKATPPPAPISSKPVSATASRFPVLMCVRFVPEGSAHVVERFGKFCKILEPGLRFLFPLIDRIAYKHSVKEEVFVVSDQTAITKDNVMVEIDGVLFYRVVDPRLASYGVSDPVNGVIQLAQTAMRSELGKITLDHIFGERASLNAKIVFAINEAAKSWGIQCMRYEIRDISPPESVKTEMERQVGAERRKRARILDSEGEKQARKNIADGDKKAYMLAAEGEADAALLRAKSTAEAFAVVSRELMKDGASEAARLKVAEHYINSFGNLAKTGTTVLLPANLADPSAMMAQAYMLYSRFSRITEDLKSTGSSVEGIPKTD